MKEHEVSNFSINDCAAEFAIEGIAATTLLAAQTGNTKNIDPTQIPLIPINTAIQAHILLPESLSINCCDWVFGLGRNFLCVRWGHLELLSLYKPARGWFKEYSLSAVCASNRKRKHSIPPPVTHRYDSRNLSELLMPYTALICSFASAAVPPHAVLYYSLYHDQSQPSQLSWLIYLSH